MSQQGATFDFLLFEQLLLLILLLRDLFQLKLGVLSRRLVILDRLQVQTQGFDQLCLGLRHVAHVLQLAIDAIGIVTR